MKLLFPNPETPVTDADPEWIIRLALESRRRIREQQKRLFKSEFRNTHFSWAPTVSSNLSRRLSFHSDEAIESHPLPPGQIWTASMIDIRLLDRILLQLSLRKSLATPK
jgi:ATP-dependent Lon protease